MDNTLTTAEKTLLEELNADLPEGVDWKQGAIDYLRNLIHSKGSQNELYHLIKPFLGGPDFEPFFSEMYGILNMLAKIDLPMKANLLDVACGPGWTAHFLAKLGHSVYGIDISEDLLEIARRRIADEPYRVFEERPLQAQFAVHDIETTPLLAEGPFDAAFFESALHHFVNPVQALRNVAPSLKHAGILCLWEGAAPRRGSPAYGQNMELMREYRTLERPYTRSQLEQVLRLAGFPHYEFFSQVNGFFNVADAGDRRRLQEQIRSAENWNIVIASRSEAFFVAHERQAALSGHAPVAARDSSPVVSPESAEWRGRDLLKENLRYLKRRLRKTAPPVPPAPRLTVEDEIRRAYLEVLGREPDAAGLAYYVGELKRGKSLADLWKSLMASDEHRPRQP